MSSRPSRESRTTVRISMATMVGSEVNQRLSALPYSFPADRGMKRRRRDEEKDAVKVDESLLPPLPPLGLTEFSKRTFR